MKEERLIGAIDMLETNGYSRSEIVEIARFIVDDREKAFDLCADVDCVRKDIRHILFDLGMPLNYNGYNYIVSAIEYAYNHQEETDDDMFNCMIYLAREYGETIIEMRREMYKIEEYTWKNADMKAKMKYFGKISSKEELQNREFIDAIVEYMRENE